MRKLIAVMTMGLMMTATTSFASPTANFEKGAVNLEIGSTLNSKVNGKGTAAADVDGKSGFKAVLTTGLSDHFALQYKQGMFTSEDSTMTSGGLPLTTYAEANLRDLNLLYKVNPNLTFLVGYEDDKISFGKYVTSASHSALHFGLTGTHKLNDKSTLFATVVQGKNVSLREIGVSYQMSQSTAFNVSYADRRIKNMDLKVPLAGINGKEDYKMTGITCLFDFKL
ncbi:hypothetical protein [Pelosinus sp. sgz500959]|uniref:hypothetical protein n=1 Tax=Pelosinus sp. sgz500959 TaxID=3242472 RepID=UPI003672C904